MITSHSTPYFPVKPWQQHTARSHTEPYPQEAVPAVLSIHPSTASNTETYPLTYNSFLEGISTHPSPVLISPTPQTHGRTKKREARQVAQTWMDALLPPGFISDYFPASEVHPVKSRHRRYGRADCSSCSVPFI